MSKLLVSFILLLSMPSSFAYAMGPEYFEKLKSIISEKNFNQDTLHKAIYTKEFDVETKKMLGKNYYKIYDDEICGGGSSMPMVKGGVIHFMDCKRHECGSERSDFFIDTRNNTISACFHLGSRGKDVWFSSEAKPRIIGAADCLDISHGDEIDFYNYMADKFKK